MILAVLRFVVDVLLLSTAMLLPLAWILRDGLGPDSGATSSGIQAIIRFSMTFYCGPVLLVLGTASIICHRAGRKTPAGD